MNNGYLVRTYGLTTSGYNKILKDQNGACAICGRTDLKLNVDHNHVNGRVRSLLCFHCNTILGHAYDSVKILKNALVYMEKHSEIDSDDDIEKFMEKLKLCG